MKMKLNSSFTSGQAFKRRQESTGRGCSFPLSNKNRPFEYGPYPLERLRRDRTIIALENERPRIARSKIALSSNRPITAHAVLEDAIAKYHNIYRGLGKLKELPKKAPVPDNLHRRMVDIKGAGYFLDVAHVGICEMSEKTLRYSSS